MHRRITLTAALAGAFFAIASAASAQNAAPVTISLFAGDEGGVTAGAWGSGRGEVTDQSVLMGSRSIQVTTQGLYQGAHIDWKEPVDLAPAFANPMTYLRLQVRFTGERSTEGVFDPITGQTRQGAASPFERMRFVLTMADGRRYELVRPIEIQGADDPDAWVSIAFPLAALLKRSAATSGRTSGSAAGDAPAARAEVTVPAPTGDGAKLTQLAIFGDKYQQFHIGEISIITDDTEITVSPLEEQPGFVRDQLTFTGVGEGGASTLRYSWDFDASDGIQEDSVGRTVQHFWHKKGEYTVTLTVSDVDGLKKPATTSVTIDVQE